MTQSMLVRNSDGVFKFYQDTEIKTVTFGAGATNSSIVDLEGYTHIGLAMSTAWTAAPMSFLVSAYPDIGSFGDINVPDLPVVGGRCYNLSPELGRWRYLQIRSGSSGDAVQQVAARTLTLMLKRSGAATEVLVAGNTATATHTAVTAGLASVQVVAANTTRKYLLIINDSDEVIYLNFGAAAVLNTGIRLNAAGGNLELSSVAGNLYTGVINAIAAAGNKNLLVTQV